MNKKKPNKPRLLLIGDAVVPTGFGRVVHHIAHSLKTDFEIHHLGINYHGDPHDLPWRVYPAAIGGEAFGYSRLPTLLNTIQPEIVMVVCDVWVMATYAHILQPYKERLRTVGYFPLEGAPLSPSIAAPLNIFDRLVAYNQFGANTIREAFEQAQTQDSTIFPRDFDTIPHGVDTDVFKPLFGALEGDRSEAKKRLFPEGEEYHDSFVVFNGNRNQPRKRIDTTMKGFALFAKDKPANVKLYLHMGTTDVGWDIIEMATRLNIDNRLILTSQDKNLPSESPERQNMIYNACDVGINTATGEGWGLVSFEHAATGAAQLIPNHSACSELWQGFAEMMEPSYSLTTPDIMTEAWFLTEETVASGIQALYDDPKLKRERDRQALEVATLPEYQWSRIGDQWKSILQELLHCHPRSAQLHLTQRQTG